MSLSRSVVKWWPVVLTVAVLGCEPTPPPPAPAPPAPVSSRDVATVQSEFARRDPNSRVGTVSAVRSQDSLAAVSGINLMSIRPGDAISFVDSSQTAVAHGLISNVDTTDNLLVVKYTPASGGRAPNKGDIAIWFAPTP